jgi:hypothetical protein
MHRLTPIAASIILVLIAAAPASRPGVVIDQKPTVVSTRTFDPHDPPKAMPKLTKNEAAVTECEFGIQTQAGGQVVTHRDVEHQCEAQVQIDSVRMNPSLKITIWLPDHAAKKLADHEEGHHRIAELFYAHANSVAQSAADGLFAHTVQGRGFTCQAAADSAIKAGIAKVNDQYMKKLSQQAGAVQIRFDKITDHGRNPIAVEDAIRQALQDEDQKR